jgi:hypothetical protein
MATDQRRSEGWDQFLVHVGTKQTAEPGVARRSDKEIGKWRQIGVSVETRDAATTHEPDERPHLYGSRGAVCDRPSARAAKQPGASISLSVERDRVRECGAAPEGA